MLTYAPGTRCYVFLVLFGSGGAASLRGYPDATGSSIVFSMFLNTGRELRVAWRLRPAERRLEFVTTRQGDQGFEQVGQGGARRVADEPDPLAGRVALGHSLRAFSSWPGTWKGEAVDAAGKRVSTIEYSWEPILDGTSLFFSRSRASGSWGTEEAVGLLGYDPQVRAFVWLIFSAPGRIDMYTGKVRGSGELEFTGTGVRAGTRAVVHLESSGKRMISSWEQNRGGEWRLYSRVLAARSGP